MAARFWVGGTGTWDAADTTHWAATSGGAGGQSVPGVADNVTIDASSGAGTITVNTNVAVISITCGAMGMTLDFATNNNTVTLSSQFICTGTGTRTVNGGTGLWTIQGGQNTDAFSFQTATNLTSNMSTTPISFIPSTNSNGGRVFATGGKAFGAITVADCATPQGGNFTIRDGGTLASLTLTAPVSLYVTTSITITGAITATGTSSSPIGISSTNGAITVTTSTGLSAVWAYIKNITFSGGTNAATNSLNGGAVTGVTVTAPSAGGVTGVIGG
jgi:hypothetical protein